ncbi:MAG: energy transducer TonB [Flavobacteriales bacterium]|nr:energy transducer TonB [Flavobacteriales bacterium]
METKRIIAAATVLLLGLSAWAQSGTGALGGSADAAQRLFDTGFHAPTDTVVDLHSVQEPPVFPGGPDSLYRYLGTNACYPVDALENGGECTVYVEFVIRKDGRADLARVLKRVSPSIDAKALRVVGAMPQWKPGRRDGKAVAVRYLLPMHFVQGRDPALPAGPGVR